MKLKKLIKNFNKDTIIELYDESSGILKHLYNGEIWDIPTKLLECKLDTNEESFLNIDSIAHNSPDLCASMTIFIIQDTSNK